MYMNFYKKVYLGRENSNDLRSIFVDWKSLAPQIGGWKGSNGLSISRIRHLMYSIGKVPTDPDSQGFSRFMRSSTLQTIAQNIDTHLNENENVKEFETPEGLVHRTDLREFVRVLNKLSRHDYFAELEY